MSIENLDKIFHAKSVAVIGASEREGSVGYIIFKNLASSFSGKSFPINAKRESIQGVKAYPSVTAVPEKIDLAVICTPAATVNTLLEECGKAGIRGIIIISAGFAEMGEEGKKLMKQIEEIRVKYSQRIIGPNCLGVISPYNKMNASFAKDLIPEGKMAFISQSGALGTAVLDWAMSNGLGFSSFVSIGSMIDVDFGDLIEYFDNDKSTESIIMYVESVTQARKFMAAASKFSNSKPIFLIKSGRVAEGAKAAASHTGALAGEDDIYDAAFKRAGIIRVNNSAELFDCAEALALQPIPKGNKLVIITNAGGPGVMATDALISDGGKLAELSPETMKRLNESLPEFWSRSNPVDVLGDAGADRYALALDICLKDQDIDGALVILTPQAMTQSTETAKLLVEKVKGQTKPILAAWMGQDIVNEGREILRKGKIPCYETPEEATKTFVRMYEYSNNIKLLKEQCPKIEIAKVDVPKVKEVLKNSYQSGIMMLSESDSKGILEAYGIKTTAPRLAKNSAEASKLAKEIGFPVVMKIQSEDISHKSDANCVMLDIKTEEQAKAKFDEIMANAKKYNKDARLDGVTVQKMAFTIGHEVIVGSKKDSLFGSVILFGMGGVAVEAIKDRNIGFPPLNQTLAKRLIEGTKVYKLLKKGYRNVPPANMALLEETIVKFSRLLADLPEIKEIDINPIRISDKEVLALDARILLDADFFKKENADIKSHIICE